jgi:hypothetical protein
MTASQVQIFVDSVGCSLSSVVEHANQTLLTTRDTENPSANKFAELDMQVGRSSTAVPYHTSERPSDIAADFVSAGE